jgi:AcrR family transcriptional regulator
MTQRRDYLLEAAYQYVLEHGLSDLSLRPLAQAIGSSPRVLLFVFQSKNNLVRTLLARARQDELDALALIRAAAQEGSIHQGEVALVVWDWLAQPGHRGLLKLWLDAYSRSLTVSTGPLAEFGRQSVADWLPLLAGPVEPTILLALLRGGMLDLLATGDHDRVDNSIRDALNLLTRERESPGGQSAGPAAISPVCDLPAQ